MPLIRLNLLYGGYMIELLSPAGSYETMVAVINSGADAVYAGGTMFGARAYAQNFLQEELLKGIDFAHLHGKKFYLTINTLLKEREIENELLDYLTPYYTQGVDAVIVQDYGVVNFIKRHFPDLEIHGSTQMTITGPYSAAIAKEMGMKRIVTARELSLEETRRIKDETGVEIEAFIHGALCYSYSGQCLMSSMLGGRSANRGRCAGTCRLPYSTFGMDGIYPLSLKDMCTLEILPEIIDAGVDSLKIEGRMKKTSYAAGVTAIYRKYLDELQKNGKDHYNVKKEDLSKLLRISNRSGYTKGYFKEMNSADMVTLNKPSYDSEDSPVEVKNEKIKLNCEITIFRDNPVKIMVRGEDVVEVMGGIPSEALNAPLTEESVLKQINKTGDTEFVFENIKINLENGLFYNIKDLNGLRRTALEEYQEKILRKHRKSINSSYNILESSFQYRDKPILKLNCMVEDISQFEVVNENENVDKIYLDYRAVGKNDIMALTKKAHKNNKKIYLSLPVIFREKAKENFHDADFDGYLIKNFEEYGYIKANSPKKMVADSNIYLFNRFAIDELEKFDIENFTVPIELNEREIEELEPYNFEMVVYGRQELMTTANCIKKTMGKCDGKDSTYEIKDRYGVKFPVRNNCETCTNTIYNGKILSLISQSREIRKYPLGSVRLNFTFEKPEEVNEILKDFTDAFLFGKSVENNIKDFTKGHFSRGVQ